MLGGDFVINLPEHHPYKTYGTNHDKRGLPAPVNCNPGHSQRRKNRTYVGTRVKNTGGKGAFFFREIFSGGFDGGREVTRLTYRQYSAGNHKTNNRYRNCRYTRNRQHIIREMTNGYRVGMHDGADRPDNNRDYIAQLSTKFVDHTTGKQHGNGVHKLEYRRDIGVVAVSPAKLFGERRC